jgi:hypothetical protein
MLEEMESFDPDLFSDLVGVLYEERGSLPMALVLNLSATRHEVPRILSQTVSARLHIYHLLSLPPAMSLISDLISQVMIEAEDYTLLVGEKTLTFILDFFHSHTCSLSSVLQMLRYAAASHFAAKGPLAHLCAAARPTASGGTWRAPALDAQKLALIAQLPSVKKMSGGFGIKARDAVLEHEAVAWLQDLLSVPARLKCATKCIMAALSRSRRAGTGGVGGVGVCGGGGVGGGGVGKRQAHVHNVIIDGLRGFGGGGGGGGGVRDEGGGDWQAHHS